MVEERTARVFLIQISSKRAGCLERGQNAALPGYPHPFPTVKRTEAGQL